MKLAIERLKNDLNHLNGELIWEISHLDIRKQSIAKQQQKIDDYRITIKAIEEALEKLSK